MKLITIFCLLLFVSVSALAQVQPQQQFDEKRLFYIKKTEKFRKLKNNGILLTLVGGVVTGIGISTLSKVTYVTNSYGTTTVTSGDPTAGVLEFMAGMGCMGAGIPLWIVGGHGMKKYNRKLEMEFKTNYGQRQAGLTFTYRF